MIRVLIRPSARQIISNSALAPYGVNRVTYCIEVGLFAIRGIAVGRTGVSPVYKDGKDAPTGKRDCERCCSPGRHILCKSVTLIRNGAISPNPKPLHPERSGAVAPSSTP
jgi:hypothetical protein